MWTQGTLEQLFIMAESGRKSRREELRELVMVSHGEPKAFLESLKTPDEIKEGAGIALATQLGDQNTARRLKRDALARKWMKDSKRQ